jgi:hypothetical protein
MVFSFIEWCDAGSAFPGMNQKLVSRVADLRIGPAATEGARQSTRRRNQSAKGSTARRTALPRRRMSRAGATPDDDTKRIALELARCREENTARQPQ